MDYYAIPAEEFSTHRIYQFNLLKTHADLCNLFARELVDLIKNKEIHFIINTVSGSQAQKDSFSIRQNALQYKVPFTTTISGAIAVVDAIEMLKKKKVHIKPIQKYHKGN